MIFLLTIVIFPILLSFWSSESCQPKKKHVLILLIIWFYPNCCKNLLNLLLKKIKSTRRVSSVAVLLYNFSISVTPTACILCILTFQFWCYSYIKRIPHWLPIFLIIISNDIHMNPGLYYKKDCFNFVMESKLFS